MKDLSEFSSRLETSIERVTESGCWIWMLGTEDGYGRIRIGERMVLAHRLSYTASFGDIPESLCVLHRCDVRSCVNPNHLFVGTNLDNVIDKVKKGRHRTGERMRGEGHTRSVLKEHQVLEIIADSRPQRAIAKSYGINQSHVSAIKNGKTWAHLAKATGAES